MDAIRKRIDNTLKNNSYLSEKLENLKRNYNRSSSHSKADEIEISKRQENLSNAPENRSQSGLNSRSGMNPQLPPISSFSLPTTNLAGMEDRRYMDSLSKLFQNSNQNHQPHLNSLVDIINPDTQLLVKSLVMQDLFTSAFKRFLHSSKPTILQNLNQSLGVQQEIPPPMPLEVLRRHSETKRKNTDPITSETIESDLNLPHMGSQATRNTPTQMRQQMSLSAFFPNQKARSMSLSSPQPKKDTEKWDPREERKQ